MDNFLSINKLFWEKYEPKFGKRLLVEEAEISYVTHLNSIFALILNQSRFFQAYWIKSSNINEGLIKSYISNTQFIKIKSNFFRCVICIANSIYFYLRILAGSNILGITYKDVRYGDIIYDTYLAENKVGTINGVPIKLIGIIYRCIYRHEEVRSLIYENKIDAVLVSHQVNISSGVMLRAAIASGREGYLRCGSFRSTLQRLTTLDDVYEYEYKPASRDIQNIVNRYGKNLDDIFNRVYEREISGNGSVDAKRANEKNSIIFSNRQNFCKTYNLDPSKKNIFIMLHAFTDYPHSHFRWMLFRDYLDWFLKTLDVAKRNKNVNWIFKQHPSVAFYPLRNFSFESAFSRCPDNIIYISELHNLNPKTIINSADCVVTCLGSAGFEMPAIAGIPSITAGDNFYTGINVAIEPTSISEYYDLLSNIEYIERVSEKSQICARAAYIFIYEFSMVQISAAPFLSVEQQNASDINQSYWAEVEILYRHNAENIYSEIDAYIEEVRRPNFKRLLNRSYES